MIGKMNELLVSPLRTAAKILTFGKGRWIKMNLGIGIDTGGTYTDAVIYDFDEKNVVAKGKSLTTKEDLAIGIAGAIDSLPQDLISSARIIALSTTLATNACVENKGGRAKLMLIGASRKVLEWVDSETTYGIKNSDVICVDKENAAEPDWESVFKENADWLGDAQAIGIAESDSAKNGAYCEKKAKGLLKEKYGIPVIIASELAHRLNVLERGATALLNARLLPVIEEFMEAVARVMKKRNLSIPVMIVRSDGSLMSEQISMARPVETILSGPAASVLGSRGLTDSSNCLIVDMGGTTTDISIVEDGIPRSTGTIRVGGWRTQVKGVYIDTFGLGGDSRFYIKDNKLCISERRVQPLCVLAQKFPQIKKYLRELAGSERVSTHPLHEFLYLLKEPGYAESYSAAEVEIIKALRNGPIMLGSGIFDLYNLKCERLEDEGIIMRCGLTPTDIMHIKGDFDVYDKEASELAARYFMNGLTAFNTGEMSDFAEAAYDRVKKTLYENIVRILMAGKYPDLADPDKQLGFMISESWENRSRRNGFFNLGFSTGASLVGIGAPTHIFLPDVAKALGAGCIIPDHAEVANAVGAIIADISAVSEVKILPNYSSGVILSYSVQAGEGTIERETLEEAVETAGIEGGKLAEAEARRRGAIGRLKIKTQVHHETAESKDGMEIYLESVVAVSATQSR